MIRMDRRRSSIVGRIEQDERRGMRSGKSWVTEETSFVVLRALAMLGGLTSVFLVQHPPEHQPYLGGLAWAFVAYKLLLFLAIRAWVARLRIVLLATTVLDLSFVGLFVWLGGGLESHFYLLFYLLVALAAVHFGPGVGIATAGGASVAYAVASAGVLPHHDWTHLIVRVATFFLLGGALGYLSRRERLARTEAERLNEELKANQDRLEKAYQELQAAQERMVRSERLATIGQMSAKVSHEVRNPLSSISLNVELLEDELSALPVERRVEARHLVRAIRSQVDTLSAVTEAYLGFARLPKPRPQVVSLGSVVADLADFVREELRARKVQLAVDAEPGLPAVRVDAGQIRQALLNLIRNAAEAMPDGGIITLAAQRVRGEGQFGNRATRQVGSELKSDVSPGSSDCRIAKLQSCRVADSVEVTVKDTGVGIAPEERERVFEPFFTSKDGGTGLGLAISREIVVGHGGSLVCESNLGSGATFRLTLPAAEVERAR
jgi:signal transduction histidine kinase